MEPNLTLLHSEGPKLYTNLALLSATGLKISTTSRNRIQTTSLAGLHLSTELSGLLVLKKGLNVCFCESLTLLHSEWPKIWSFGHSECNRVKTVQK